MTGEGVDHCKNEGIIATHDAILRSISETLKEIKEGQKENTVVLRSIAEQGQRIVNLEENVNRIEKDTDNLFGRVRSLEIAPAQETGKMKISAFAAVLSAVFSGAVSLLMLKVFGK